MTISRVQFTFGRGCTTRRWQWWPRHGQISLRVWREWWACLHWWLKAA